MAEFIFTGQNNAADTTPVQKRRTLMIGIGGSGKEVLMRFRKKLAYIYNGFERHPYINYLWIDTDSGNKNIRNQTFDRTYSLAQLSEGEIIDVHMTVNELQHFYDNFNIQENYHHWFNYEALKGMGAAVLEHGASAMRPFGKLAFWYHASKIERTLRQTINNLKNPSFEISNLASAEEVDVYIIGSLAGGTGSGMLLDIAAMLQMIDPKLHRNGIFFLSDVFSHDEKNPIGGSQVERDANCFAALQELDFYMTSDNQHIQQNSKSLFNFSWNNALKHTVNLPIYSKVNLISNTYENAQVEPSLEEALNLVAEYLIMGYNDTGFDSDVRSSRVNVIKGYTNKFHFRNALLESGETRNIYSPYTTTYSGIGLGLIEFNKRQIQNWAKYKFLSAMCHDLLSQDKPDTSIYMGHDGNITLDILSPDKLWNSIETGGTSISPIDTKMQAIDRQMQEKVESILNRPDIRSGNIQDTTALKSSLNSDLSAFFTTLLDQVQRETQDDHNHRGGTITALKANIDHMLNRLPLEINRFYYGVLEKLHEKGLVSAKSMLDEVLVNQVSALQRYVKSKTKDQFTFTHPDGIQLPNTDELDNAIKYAQDAADIPLFFIGYRKKAVDFSTDRLAGVQARFTADLKQAIKTYVDAYKEQLRKLLQSNCYGVISNGLNQAVAKVQSSANQLKNSNHESVTQLLRDWWSVFEADAKAFDIESDSLALRKLVLDTYLKADIKRMLDEVIQEQRDNDYHDFLVRLADKLKSKLEHVLNEKELPNTPAMMFAYAMANHQDLLHSQKLNLKACVEEIAAQYFANFLAGKRVDIELLRLLNTPHHKAEIEMKIRSAYDQACMRLGFIPNPGITDNRERELFRVNGINTDTSPALRDKLIEIFGRDIGFSTSNLEESIVFYKEGSGFPLVGLTHVEDFRPHFYHDIADNPARIYQRYTTKDFEHLRDLRCMNDSQFQQFSSYYLLAMKAVFLGVIRYEKIMLNNNQSEWRFRYHYREKGIDHTRDLLKRLESVAEELSQPHNAAMMEKIKRQAVMDSLSVQELWELMGAVRHNIQNSPEDKAARNSTTMGVWALKKIQDMLEAQIRQQMAGTYPDKDMLDKYIEEQYDEPIDVSGCTKLEYYTIEFVDGIHVKKP